MKKRVLVSMMVLSVAVACLAGCGKKSETTSTTTTEATTEAKETEAKATEAKETEAKETEAAATEATTEAPADTETEA